MEIVTKLELPIFDYTDPSMTGERFHRTVTALSAEHQMALGPYGCIFFDRQAVDFFLRHPGTITPGRPMTQMFALGDGALSELIERNILNVEGDVHRRLRNLVNPPLTPRAVHAYRPLLRALFSELLAAVECERVVEFVSAVAKPYPARVIAALLGAPPEDAEQIQHWSHWIERQFDIAVLATESEKVETAVQELFAYLSRLLRRHRQAPGEDIVSRLLHTGVERDRLSDLELFHLVANLLGGGVDTVQSQLAQMLRLFAEHPEQWQLIREQPASIPTAIEEAARFCPILPFTARVLVEDVDYRGVEFPAGTVVMLCIYTANRDLDGDRANAHSFDIRARRSPRPLTFGVGSHYCMGANLAQAELEEALSLLSARFSTVRPVGEPVYGSITGIYGLESLPLAFADA
jgi:cytochrome P450